MKKIIALSLALVLAFACILTSCSKKGSKLDDSALDDLVVEKESTLENGEKYSFELIDSETVVITDYEGSHDLHEVNIPSRLVVDAKPEGYIVVGIDANAFYHNVAITSITVPEGVTYIGDYAFAGCSELKSVTLPSTVTSIGNFAFYACKKLEAIDVPDAVDSIGEGAFTDCAALKTVDFPTALKTIGKGAFRKCVALEEVNVDSTALESIGVEAFYDCAALKKVTLPEAAKENLGSNAFVNCNAELAIEYVK